MKNKQKNNFNEATRVQMPALVHLNKLGYEYFGKITEDMAGTIYDNETNILIQEFEKQFCSLNPNKKDEFEQIFKDIKQELDNDDLGRSFYKRLIKLSPTKLIDFENPENNTFHYTAEFTCKNKQDEFRPDITLFINGLPLVFIEVKRPNNHGGMVAESERMNNNRFPNKKFRRFINITQFMIFSNNMEYNADGGIVPIQGAFYCTTSRNKSNFNCFREETTKNSKIAPYIENYLYKSKDNDVEKRILNDFNCHVIRNNDEYLTNLDENTPTNRIITSMCSQKRILFLLKYGIAYVKNEKEVDGKLESIDEKHIMRYQQLFASLSMCTKLDDGVRSGVIWHTQGSGKTALSYHLNHILTYYYAKQNKVAKFYFVVDRLDLLEQATQEFEARGLEVKTANNREELMKQFRDNNSQDGSSGKAEITVVNIQRFAEDNEKVEVSDYATNLQRIFIIDEAHRGYNPKGCFLANLFEADKNAIKIALTGTPLLSDERASWKVFGDYIHTYYYDKSIKDGYTLKIIREDIETSYRENLTAIQEKLEELVHKKDIKKSEIVEHSNYVKELIRFVISDLKKFRLLHSDNTLGGMIICETSQQAKNLYTYFDEIQRELNSNSSLKSDFKIGLILHDSEDKETRKSIVKDFKKNMTVDILIVFNMLLTGFDAPRLKRLYFGRKLKDHNLLQALTRVNRPYKNNRYGYVIDFADIKANFEETNANYLKELNRFNNHEEISSEVENEIAMFNQVIEDKETLIEQMQEVRQALFSFTTDNVEIFSSEISLIEDKSELLALKKILVSAKDCYNIVRTFGDDDLKETFAKLEIEKLPIMISEIQHCIDHINQKDMFTKGDETTVLINEAMQDIVFDFNKIGEEELKIADNGNDLTEKWKRTINAFTSNIDHDDPEYISLREVFMLRFKEKGFVVDSMAMYDEHSKALDIILKKLEQIKRTDNALLKRYNGDRKIVRVHKRVREENKKRKDSGSKLIISEYDEQIVEALTSIKLDIDYKIYNKSDILKNDAFFNKAIITIVSAKLKELGYKSERADKLFVIEQLNKQYVEQNDTII